MGRFYEHRNQASFIAELHEREKEVSTWMVVTFCLDRIGWLNNAIAARDYEITRLRSELLRANVRHSNAIKQHVL